MKLSQEKYILTLYAIIIVILRDWIMQDNPFRTDCALNHIPRLYLHVVLFRQAQVRLQDELALLPLPWVAILHTHD